MPSPEVVFLMYHELELPDRPLIQSAPGYVRYILPQTAFRSQIHWLRQDGWRGLNVSEALRYPPEKSVAITFDDGCETDLIAAAPVLGNAGFHATFYVTAGLLGRAGYMSQAHLQELGAAGFEIGCHSMSHPYLTDLTAEQLKVEITDAGKKLEDIIGRKVEHFSCPGGRFDDRVIRFVEQAGYRSLATSQPRANTPGTNHFSLGRVAILRDVPDAKFREICAGSALSKLRFLESVRQGAKSLMGNSIYDFLRNRFLGQK